MKDLLVETEAGKLQGVHGWDPRIAVFRGITYAAPPSDRTGIPDE